MNEGIAISRAWQRLSPPQLFLTSFVLLIGVGTLGFRFLSGLYTGEGLGWLDSLYTATSAVCVTGLIVVDTATYFSTAGQIWILLLIQLGGLGILTFASLITVMISQRLSLRSHDLTSGIDVMGHRITSGELVRRVIVYTLLFESIGFLLLWSMWGFPGGLSESFWPALFHSISAFCNAGFSTNTTSLVSYAGDPWVLTVFMGLIIAGGIGFVVIADVQIWLRSRLKRSLYQLSLHSRIVLFATVGLILGGAICFAAFEWDVTLAGMSSVDRVMNALFMSVTSRTAGFNTVDYSAVTDSSNFLTIMLMSIGGSPGSTAGGIKTTTVAVILLVAWSRLRGFRWTSFANRTIPEDTVQQAISTFALGFSLITVAIFVLIALESPDVPHRINPIGFLDYMFEAVSAFNTVGLSMGVSTEIGISGKVISVLLMFMGRVGPLAVVAAIALRAGRPGHNLQYGRENVMIG